MALQVNRELCAGCGMCMDACSVGAIQLVDQRAVIDNSLCTQCEACADACPNEAISVLSIPACSVSIATLPVAESLAPVQSQVALTETFSPTRGFVQLAGAALAFLGREAAPRLVDVLVTALERRLERPMTTAFTPLSTSPRDLTVGSRGKRRQARYRGGHNDFRNHKERR